MRAAQAHRMTSRGLDPVLPVTPVLARERAQVRTRHVPRRHRRHADDPAAAGTDARGQLAVLVHRPALVPAPQLQQQVASPHAAEARVHLRLLCGATAEARASHAERALERERDGATGRPIAHGQLRARRAGHVALLEPRDASRDVIAGIERVGVHAGHIRAAGCVQADVERVGRTAGGIVEAANAVVGARGFGDDGAAAVGRAAVDDQDLEPAVEFLLAHRRESPLQMPRLVEDRDEDGGAPIRSCPLARALVVSNAHARRVCQPGVLPACFGGPYASLSCVHPSSAPTLDRGRLMSGRSE